MNHEPAVSDPYEDEDGFDDILVGPDDAPPLDEYRLWTRPGTAGSGE
jgi:hypothetical protein